MVDVGGLELTDEDREVLMHPLVGGVLLFTRNYRDPEQLRALCGDLLSLNRERLLLAVDHEGGRVQRFRIGFSRVPTMGSLGVRFGDQAEPALADAEHWGHTIAEEIGSFGIDLCFAPVLDVDVGLSQIIGDRSFSSEPAVVVELARAFRRGLNRAGMAATGKHFPGHGAVAADSHLELPVDRRSLEEIQSTDLVPFMALIADGLESIMMAHVRYPAADDLPASLSRRWIQQVLRGQLGFDNALFCDDLSMKGCAVAGDLEARARLALEAGCDMLPVGNDRPGVIQLLDCLRNLTPDPAADRRLARLYRKNLSGGVHA